MRTHSLTLLCAVAAVAGRAPLAAQAVERTDTPQPGHLRVTFDPRIVAWGRVFTDQGLEPLGFALTGDTLGATHIPIVARLQQDARTASGVPGFIASLGQGVLTARQERRVTPVTAEVGVTDRLAFALTVPIVRTDTRTAFRLSPAGANLGPNPIATTAGAAAQYAGFFSQFNAALAELGDNIAAGEYGCAGNPGCAAAGLLARGEAVRDALSRTVYGVGTTGSPFMPRADSDAGLGIDSTVAQIQRQLATDYQVSGFTDGFLLPSDTLTQDVFASFLNDSLHGFGYNPFRHTWRYGLGDVELEAKYRIATGPAYAAALAARVRLPTGARDSTLEVLDAPIASHQLVLEARVIQELTVWQRLWLNVSLRAGTATGSTQARRVAPLAAFLVPYQATTVLNWDAGDYFVVDVAPLYRLAPQFAVGLTAGYWTQRADHYSYRSARDSLDLAARLGAAVPASVVAQGTAQRWLRLGVALTYVGRDVEGGFTVEQTVSGAGGQVPDATVFRLVMRVSEKLF
jgi:hypothetical protein